MKRLLLLLIVYVTLLSNARAAGGGMPVFDWVNSIIALTNHVAIMDKYVSIIRELEMTKDWLGNAALIRDIAGAAQVLSDLTTATEARSREELAAEATSSYAVDYTDSGLYAPVGETFRSPDGDTVVRPDVFKPEAALFSAVAEHDAVHRQVTLRREKLRGAMRETLSQLQGATNQVEILKASGVLMAQHAELDTLERETAAAAERVKVLDAQNRAAEKRAEKAEEQESAVALNEALRAFGKALKPSKSKRAENQRKASPTLPLVP